MFESRRPVGDVWVVLPAYGEARRVPRALERLAYVVQRTLGNNMKPLRFLVIGSLPAPLTGSVIRNRAIAEHLAKAGHEVFYIEPRAPSYTDCTELPNVHLIPTSYPEWPLKLGMLKAILSNTREARKVRDVDYVLAMKSLPSSCIPALLVKSKRTQVLLDIDDLEYSYWNKFLPMKSFLIVFERLVARRFNFITTHVRSLREYIGRLGVDDSKIIMLLQGIDPCKYEAIKRPAEAGGGSRTVIVFCAFLGITCDMVPIVDVYSDLKQEFPALLLRVVGDGPRLGEYKSYCRDRGIEVDFVGYKTHAEALEIVSSSDIAINYNQDSFSNAYRAPIKLREYLALEKKVVSNDIGDTHLFKDYIYMSGDTTEEFKDTLRAAILGETKPDGRAFVTANYSWARIIDTFLKGLAYAREQQSQSSCDKPAESCG